MNNHDRIPSLTKTLGMKGFRISTPAVEVETMKHGKVSIHYAQRQYHIWTIDQLQLLGKFATEELVIAFLTEADSNTTRKERVWDA